MLLDADVQAGLVVDRTGAVRGMVRVEDITRLMREGGPGRRPARPDQRGLSDGDSLGLDRRTTSTTSSWPSGSTSS